MLDKITSGGETGAEQAAWRVAKTFDVPTGGWMRTGCLTEYGPRPEFVERFGAAETPGDGNPEPSEGNVRDSDATLWFGETTTAAAQATVAVCRRLGKPCMLIYPLASFEPWHVVAWIAANRVKVLNVAGNCEREEPGIGGRVETFLTEALEQLGHKGRGVVMEAGSYDLARTDWRSAVGRAVVGGRNAYVKCYSAGGWGKDQATLLARLKREADLLRRVEQSGLFARRRPRLSAGPVPRRAMAAAIPGASRDRCRRRAGERHRAR